MNPKESSEVTVEILLALRQQPDALRLITEKLHVKAMGPADHIRTKHEVKLFVESGDAAAAATMIRSASERMTAGQTVSNKLTEQQQRVKRMNT